MMDEDGPVTVRTIMAVGAAMMASGLFLYIFPGYMGNERFTKVVTLLLALSGTLVFTGGVANMILEQEIYDKKNIGISALMFSLWALSFYDSDGTFMNLVSLACFVAAFYGLALGVIDLLRTILQGGYTVVQQVVAYTVLFFHVLVTGLSVYRIFSIIA